VHDAPQPLNQLVADVPRPFEAIVAKLLAKNPQMRYASADAVREDLRRFRTGEPVQALATLVGNAPVTGAMPATVAVPRAVTGATVAVPPTVVAPRAAPPMVGATAAMPRTMVVQQQYAPARQQGGRRGRGGLLIFITLLAIAAIVAGGFVLYNSLADDGGGGGAAAEEPTTVELPSVTGLQLEEALALLEDADLASNPIAERNDAVPENVVHRMDPPAGTVVPTGQSITLYFNPIREPVPVPEVAGLSIEEATAILEAAGFTVDFGTPETTPDVEVNRVIRSEPPATTELRQGDTVLLIVSGGPEQVTIPATEGLTQDEAVAALTAEPLTLNVTVQQEASDTVEAGRVIRSEPPTGTVVPKSSDAVLVVSTGVALVKVPPLEDLTEAQARNQLATAGLGADVQLVTVAFGSPDAGRVISQSIDPGTDVPPGTVVRLRVGQAAAAPTTVPATTTTTTTTAPPPPTLPPTTAPPETTTTVTELTTTTTVV